MNEILEAMTDLDLTSDIGYERGFDKVVAFLTSLNKANNRRLREIVLEEGGIDWNTYGLGACNVESGRVKIVFKPADSPIVLEEYDDQDLSSFQCEFYHNYSRVRCTLIIRLNGLFHKEYLMTSLFASHSLLAEKKEHFIRANSFIKASSSSTSRDGLVPEMAPVVGVPALESGDFGEDDGASGQCSEACPVSQPTDCKGETGSPAKEELKAPTVPQVSTPIKKEPTRFRLSRKAGSSEKITLTGGKVGYATAEKVNKRKNPAPSQGSPIAGQNIKPLGPTAEESFRPVRRKGQ